MLVHEVFTSMHTALPGGYVTEDGMHCSTGKQASHQEKLFPLAEEEVCDCSYALHCQLLRQMYGQATRHACIWHVSESMNSLAPSTDALFWTMRNSHCRGPDGL